MQSTLQIYFQIHCEMAIHLVFRTFSQWAGPRLYSLQVTVGTPNSINLVCIEALILNCQHGEV